MGDGRGRFELYDGIMKNRNKYSIRVYTPDNPFAHLWLISAVFLEHFVTLGCILGVLDSLVTIVVATVLLPRLQ